MRAFKTLAFARDAKRLGLNDVNLARALTEVQNGLVDARLGGTLFKKRISVGNRGKSAGLRTIIVYRPRADKMFCVYVFAKKQLENLSSDEYRDLQELGKQLLLLPDSEISLLIDSAKLMEVKLE